MVGSWETDMLNEGGNIAIRKASGDDKSATLISVAALAKHWK
jgi:hypothetical protein